MKMKKEEGPVSGFLEEIKRSEAYTADHFMSKYGNNLPHLFFPYVLAYFAFFSMMFISVPTFCSWGRTVTTIIDIGVLAGSLLIGALIFYEAFNNLMVVLSAVVFLFSKVLKKEHHNFDRKTVSGLAILTAMAVFYLAVSLIAAKLIGDNAGRALACW